MLAAARSRRSVPVDRGWCGLGIASCSVGCEELGVFIGGF